ncbi:VirB3 family type IV secretion system protein [Limnohabitans lacus]|uniref:VirB3 family type IV secretion system protein n=1 Tax=Limnohabitans lacus TaxID=3045173 RepID=UPI003D6791AE
MPECRVFKGATRPPMIGGVPLVPIVVLSLTTLMPLAIFVIARIYVMVPVFILIFLTGFLWLRLISKKDGWRFKQEFLRFRLRAQKGNPQIWGGISYSPLRIKKHKAP